MKSVRNVLAGAAAFAVFGGGVASAQEVVTLTPGSGWSVFEWFGTGTQFVDYNDFTSPFFGDTINYDFTITTPTMFRVTDGYFDGDQFDLTVTNTTDAMNPVTVDEGPTSTPVFDADYVGPNWSEAFFYAGDKFSHASYLLDPGSYDVTGVAILSPGFGDGAGAVSLGAVEIPEPSCWILMLVGFGGLGLLARRRARAGATL